jgi:hypothetical protein
MQTLFDARLNKIRFILIRFRNLIFVFVVMHFFTVKLLPK